MLDTCDQTLGLTGFHRPSDNLDRGDMARLPDTVEILARFVRWIDEEGLVHAPD